MTTLVLFGTLFFAFAIGMPIAFALGLSSLAAIYFTGNLTPVVFIQKMFSANDNFPMLAIPFFIFAGGIMARGGISRRLVDLANILVGWLPGGLAIVAVLGSVFFGAICGSPVATVAAVGSIIIPSMVRNGYDKAFCGAVQAAAGPLGSLIPPSIALIIYGVTANMSIGDLFLATVVPGLLMGFALMCVSGYLAWRKGYGRNAAETLPSLGKALKEASWAMIMPAIILGGIYGGICTPTEAAVLAVAYGFIAGTLIYRELKMSMMGDILIESVVGTALIMIIIDFSTVFSTFLASNHIPQLVADTFLGLTDSTLVIMVLINIMLLVIGTFMELAPAMVIMIPILLPIADRLAYHPIHFAMIVTCNLLIGLVTPPVGLTLFMGSRISGAKIDRVINELWPLLITMALVLVLVNLFPGLSLCLLDLINS